MFYSLRTNLSRPRTVVHAHKTQRRLRVDSVEKLCFEMSGDFICDMSGIAYCSYEGVAEVA